MIPILADHVWQSTLFAAGAAVLALSLAKNQARVRYWIWLAASLKFLVPFSLLVAIGSHLGWSGTSQIAPRAVAAAVEVVGQPFSRTETDVAASSEAGTVRPESTRSGSVVAPVLLSIWFAGCAAVLVGRWLSWRKIARDVRGTVRMKDGRAYEAWSRLLHAAGLTTPVRLLSSATVLEPAVVGSFRPAVLWPAAVSDLLEDAQLEAILIHELSHVRRRDNLAGLVHMAVEAAFWFHPVVWWLTARLVEARERACDEAVLALGAEPQHYAEGLLKVCRHCLESPLPSVTGVTGSNLTRRIEQIMTGVSARPLNWGKRLLLSAAAATVVVGPIVVGVMSPIAVRAEPATDAVVTPESVVPASVPSLTPMVKPNLSVQASRAQGRSPAPSTSQEDRQAKTWIHVTIDGRDSLGFVPRDEPYAAGGPSVSMPVPANSPARTKDGLVIGGFEFIGWKEGERVRVLVFAMVPTAGEPSTHLHRVDLASYLVGPAVDVTVDAIHATGFTPVVRLRANTSGPESGSGVVVNAPGASSATGQIFDVGNGVSAPVVVTRVDPVYTEEAKQAKIQGEVELGIVVQTDGTVQNIRVTKSLGSGYGLDQSAIDAARQWRFKPGMKDGKPVPVRVTLILEFRLRDSPPPAVQEATIAEFGKGAHKADEPRIVQPKIRHKLDPTYSSDALRAKISGTVKVDAVVLADGTMGEVRIVDSLDKIHGLDDAAVKAVRQWTFEPATLDGQAVPVIVSLTLEFRLH